MKKVFLALSLFCGALNSTAAEPATIVAPTTSIATNFVLYPTFNIYTFLKLDTRNGRIWQVQYSLDADEFEVKLNSIALTTDDKAGRFALYPTSNNWTFLLLDTEDGRVWHIQWSQDPTKRGILPIKAY